MNLFSGEIERDNMHNKQCENRLQWLDEVKGLGILLMVIGHAGAPKYLVHWIYGFHMPLFFGWLDTFLITANGKKEGL